MSTAHRPCPRCGSQLWVRFRIYEGRARTFDSPAEPAERVPIDWACEEGCELGEGEVQALIEDEPMEAIR